MRRETKRRLSLAVGYLLLLAGGWWLGKETLGLLQFELMPSSERQVHSMLLATVLLFAVASAIPFVPGAEIGLGLMLMFGSRMALLVYLAMTSALLFAFMIGRLVPISAIAASFKLLGFSRAHGLVTELGQVAPEAWPERLAQIAPGRFTGFLIGHRYLALALLFNLPGNSLAGGGGGLALTAGISRLFRWPAYLLTVLLAVAPVPLMFALIGAT